MNARYNETPEQKIITPRNYPRLIPFPRRSGKRPRDLWQIDSPSTQDADWESVFFFCFFWKRAMRYKIVMRCAAPGSFPRPDFRREKNAAGHARA